MLAIVIEVEADRATLTSPDDWRTMRFKRPYDLVQDIHGDDLVGLRDACRSMAEDAGEDGFELEDAECVRILAEYGRGGPARSLHWNDLMMLFEHLRASGTHPDALKLFGERLEDKGWGSRTT